MSFQQKYLKYKKKYLQLKGGFNCPDAAKRGEDHPFNSDTDSDACMICVKVFNEPRDYREPNRKLISCCHLMCEEHCEWGLKYAGGLCPICRNISDGFFVKYKMKIYGGDEQIMWLNPHKAIKAKMLVDKLVGLINTPEFQKFKPKDNLSGPEPNPTHQDVEALLKELANTPLGFYIAAHTRPIAHIFKQYQYRDIFNYRTLMNELWISLK